MEHSVDERAPKLVDQIARELVQVDTKSSVVPPSEFLTRLVCEFVLETPLSQPLRARPRTPKGKISLSS